MYKAVVGNLIELIDFFKLDGIQNAANGVGPMGRGIAGAIKKFGGNIIQTDAYCMCSISNTNPGQAYATISGNFKDLGVKKIIHAITMKNPGGYTDYDTIEKAFKSSINLAKIEGITKFGCTALGTGVGGLNAVKVAEIMGKIAKEEKELEIIFIDFDEDFIKTLNEMK